MEPARVRPLLWATSFTSGMCVMALEMTASRVVAPHFGTSISVWANVIGIVMVALALGYWLGGRLAERSPRPEVLWRALAVGALLAGLAPALAGPLARTVIEALRSAGGSRQVTLGSFVTLVALFGLPVGLLGITSPFVIKLLAGPGQDAGKVSGGVFALSTVGSIFGTFLPAFWLVPTLGTRATVLIFAALLLAVALAGLAGLKGGALGAALLAPLPWLAHAAVRPSPGQLAEAESDYQYVEVVQHPDGSRALRFDEGITIQSLERPDSPLSGGYWDLVLPLPALARAEKPKALILGLGAGSIARGLVETRAPGAIQVVGVELDPKVVEYARTYFSLGRLGDRVEVHTEDARAFLTGTREKFDFILLDVYANQRYIPPHLVTAEFFALAKEHLAPGGLLVANVNSPTRESLLLRSFLKTMRQAFGFVDAVEAGGRSWNRELVASEDPLDWDGAAARVPEALQAVYARARANRALLDDSGGLVLTDDRAPVELLTDAAVFAASR